MSTATPPRTSRGRGSLLSVVLVLALAAGANLHPLRAGTSAFQTRVRLGQRCRRLQISLTRGVTPTPPARRLIPCTGL